MAGTTPGVHGAAQARFGLSGLSQDDGTRATDVNSVVDSAVVADDAEVTAAIATHAAVVAAAGTHGRVKQVFASGTGIAADVTVTGVVVGDVLVSVFSFTTAASIATAADRTSEYTIQAGGLDKAAGTDETGNQLLITYIDAA